MIQILEGLYLGNLEAARDARRLREAGITHVVNCTEELPNYHEGAFTYLALKLADPDPRLHRHFRRVCAFIDEGRKSGGVLVHCFAGVSRSPAVVLTYLCHRGDTLEGAARKLGAIVWTNPDRLFLLQLARHFGEEAGEPELESWSNLLLGRSE
jgi:predicted protein tyrosine phosphatase